MIEDPPLLSIARRIARPASEIVKRFAGTPTSFLVDAMGGAGALDWRIKPVAGNTVIGVALTCDCGPADNLALCAAVAQCEPGDVLVAATAGYVNTSVAGDLLLGIAKNRGAAGFVTDGMIRDANDIERLQFPCFALGITPNSPARNGPGTVGLPILCGGLAVSSGDIVVGDRDGVVVIPQQRIDETLANLERVRKKEAELLKAVQGGLKDVGFVKAILEDPQTRFVD